MSSGKKQFILIAIAATLFAAIMLGGVAGNVLQGNYRAVPLVLGALVLASLVAWFGFRFNRRQVRMMFLDASPDRLIAHYHATIRRIPNAGAATAYLSALAAAAYGQFDRARKELEAVDWGPTPAIYKGHRLHALAVIALLESNDKAEALRLSVEADAVAKKGPSAETPILHDAILVAVGSADTAVIGRTKEASARATGMMQALCVWALMRHFEASGQTAESSIYRERLRAAIPRFVGLEDTAESPSNPSQEC
jgi:hypothetical protein